VFAPLGGEQGTYHAGDKNFVRSNLDTPASDGTTVQRRMPTIDPKDLIGRSFLKDTVADGQRFRAKIVRASIEKYLELKRDPNHNRFLCELDGDTIDDIYTYNQILEFIERVWILRVIQNSFTVSAESAPSKVLYEHTTRTTRDLPTTYS
jgi:hypothetical protein